MLSRMDQQFKDKDKSNSESFVWEYQSNFLTNAAAPGIDWEFATTKKVLPTIVLQDVNGLIKNYIKEDNRVVVITAPEKVGLKKVTEQEVLDALKVNPSAITAYKDTEIAKGLLRNEIKVGSVLKKEINETTNINNKLFIISKF